MREQGISTPIIIVGVLVVLGILGVLFLTNSKSSQNNNQSAINNTQATNPTVSNSTPQPLQTFTDPKGVFSFQYPSDWTVADTSILNDNQPSWSISSPKSTNGSSNVSFALSVYPERRTLTTVTQTTLSKMANAYSNFSTEQDSDVMLGSVPSHKLVFKGTSKGLNVYGKFISIYGIYKGNLYNLTFSQTTDDKFASGLSTFQTIADSFKFTN